MPFTCFETEDSPSEIRLYV